MTWRLLRVRAEAFDRYHGSELVNRFFDIVTVQKSVALLLIDGLSILMQTIIGMVLIAFYHPWLLAFDVLLIIAMLVIVFVLGRGAVATSISESKIKYALEAWLEQLAAHLITFKSEGGARFAMRQSQQLLESTCITEESTSRSWCVRSSGRSRCRPSPARRCSASAAGW